MALTFSSGTSCEVNCGSNAILDDMMSTEPISSCAWIRLSGGTASGRVWQKAYIAAHSTYTYFGIQSSNTEIEYNSSFTTSSVVLTAVLSNFSAFGIGKWLFVGFTGVPASGYASTDLKLVMGDSNALCSFPTSYKTQTLPVGTHQTDAAANLILGNRGGSSTNFHGDIAWVGIWRNRLFTLQDFHNVQLATSKRIPHNQQAGCVLDMWLGENGTSQQRDYSNYANHGTVTAATWAPTPESLLRRHAPIKDVLAGARRVYVAS